MAPRQNANSVCGYRNHALWEWRNGGLVKGVGLQPLVVVVGTVGVCVVNEVGRRADLVVEADVPGLFDGGRGDLVRLWTWCGVRVRCE